MKADVFGGKIATKMAGLEDFLKGNNGGNGFFVGDSVSIWWSCIFVSLVSILCFNHVDISYQFKLVGLFADRSCICHAVTYSLSIQVIRGVMKIGLSIIPPS